MSIVVVGSVAFDDVETPHGQGRRRARRLGLVLLGGGVLLRAGAAGGGGRRAISRDERARVPRSPRHRLTGLERAPGKTFRWTGRYYEDMNRRDTLRPAAQRVRRLPAEAAGDATATREYPLPRQHPSGAAADVLDQVRGAALVGCDTMNLWIDERAAELWNALLERVDLLVINDEEARPARGEHNLRARRARIRALGPKQRDRQARRVRRAPFSADSRVRGAGVSARGGGRSDRRRRHVRRRLHGRARRVRRHLGAQALRRAMFYGSVMASFFVEDFG